MNFVFIHEIEIFIDSVFFDWVTRLLLIFAENTIKMIKLTVWDVLGPLSTLLEKIAISLRLFRCIPALKTKWIKPDASVAIWVHSMTSRRICVSSLRLDRWTNPQRTIDFRRAHFTETQNESSVGGGGGAFTRTFFFFFFFLLFAAGFLLLWKACWAVSQHAFKLVIV